MKHSFAPLDEEAIVYLSEGTGIDYTETDFDRPEWLCVTGRHEQGWISGVAICQFSPWFEAHFSIAVGDKRFVTRRILRAFFTTVFSQATRCTALVEPWNAPAIRQAELMGFQREGFCRNIIEGDRDGILYGMLVEDCHYLKVRPTLPKPDFGDGPSIDVKAGRYVGMSAGRSPDLQHLSGG